MRKLFLLTCFFAPGSAAVAQNLDAVQTNLSNSMYTEAKEKIDQFLKDPANKNNAKAWFYKGKTYTALFKADADNTISYDAGGEAFRAFRKYQDLDPKNTEMAAENYVGYFELFDAGYNKGIKLYNAKNYAEAFSKFKAAIEVEDYAGGKGYSYNGFSFPKLDTQLVNLAGSSAYLSKNEDAAIPYYKRLADAGLSMPDYKEIYAMLVQYYQKKNDPSNAGKYLGMGKKFFPDEDYWLSIEFGDPGTDPLSRFKQYEKLLVKYPGNYLLAMDYAAELFNYTYVNDNRPTDYSTRRQKLEAALLKALALRSTALDNFLMAQHIDNGIVDLYDELTALAPADREKRNAVRERISTEYESLYKYAKPAYDLYDVQPSLTDRDKSNFKQVIVELIAYYKRKKDDVNEKIYLDKKAALN